MALHFVQKMFVERHQTDPSSKSRLSAQSQQHRALGEEHLRLFRVIVDYIAPVKGHADKRNLHSPAQM